MQQNGLSPQSKTIITTNKHPLSMKLNLLYVTQQRKKIKSIGCKNPRKNKPKELEFKFKFFSFFLLSRKQGLISKPLSSESICYYLAVTNLSRKMKLF